MHPGLRLCQLISLITCIYFTSCDCFLYTYIYIPSSTPIFYDIYQGLALFQGPWFNLQIRIGSESGVNCPSYTPLQELSLDSQQP